MKIYCIEVGLPPPPINDEFGYYPQMLEALLRPYIKEAHFATCSLIRGEELPQFGQFDGFVIMGSPHGVYEDLPWINALMEFVETAAKLKIPHCGICFGHQLIAKVHGGRVEKAPQGWGIGRHTYEVIDWPSKYNFIDETDERSEEDKAKWPSAQVRRGRAGVSVSEQAASDKKIKQVLNLLVSHQDQVLEAPKNAKTIARSEFTPHAMLHYEDACALTCQAHPEFSSDFAAALISSRRGTRFTEDMADLALETIHHELDAHILADLMAHHFYKNLKSQVAA
jgi:GMP synthase-like glutamine amidotransferase